MSVVFLVKECLITISPKKDIRHPVRGSSHLLTDYIQVNAGAAFYYQFIVDVSDDKTMREDPHSIAEDVPADRLNDILNKFRTIGFDALPVLGGTDTFIGNRFTAEFVFLDLRLHIGEKPA